MRSGLRALPRLRHRKADPFELSTEGGYRLLETVRSFGNPLTVFTGGDPLKRSAVFELLEKSVQLGLCTTIAPSATALMTEAAVDEFRGRGVARIAAAWRDASRERSWRSTTQAARGCRPRSTPR